jgi:hypothetical protein
VLDVCDAWHPHRENLMSEVADNDRGLSTAVARGLIVAAIAASNSNCLWYPFLFDGIACRRRLSMSGLATPGMPILRSKRATRLRPGGSLRKSLAYRPCHKAASTTRRSVLSVSGSTARIDS